MGSFYQRRGKRMLDAIGAAGGLLLTAPVQVVVAAVVSRKMGSPVLFRQVRPGLGGRPFTLMKFRTMLDVLDGAGVARSDAERMTGLGRWLRASSIDELPELWNVLRGEMSLVGPRPLMMEYLPSYSPEQARRHDVRPGLTGWAQVNGRNALSWEAKFDLDVWYVDNVTLRLDLRVILMTFRTLWQREGTAPDGYAITPEFMPIGGRSTSSEPRQC
jgi:lipopolysaccharide/colanic/teichoic acid biosynthesis glycosyltransferase